MMTRDQIMAKVLFSNRIVTEAQIQEFWPRIDASHHLGELFLQAGILDKATYDTVTQYVQNLEAKLAAAEEEKEKERSAFERPAPKVNPVKVDVTPSAPKEKRPAETPFAIEGNNPYGDTPTESVRVEQVEGLEQTAIAPGVFSEEDSTESGFDDDESLPDRFEVDSGEGAVAAPESLTEENSLAQVLAFARKARATDVYLSASNPVALRIFGKLHYATEKPFAEKTVSRWLSEAQKGFADGYEPSVGKDFSKSFALEGAGRNRLTVMWNGTLPALSIRLISGESFPLERLCLPAFCEDFVNLPHGLLLFAGPSGSGRSTTLHAFAETLAQKRDILMESIEKPIERLLKNANGMTVQKEVGLHVLSGVSAVNEAVRDGANVILFDHLETVQELWALLRASSAGALVLAVATGSDVYGLLSRLLSAAGEASSELAFALSEELKGVVVQHLIPVIDNGGWTLAVEAFRMTTSISGLIRQGNLIQIPSALAAAKNQAQTLDDALQNLVDSGYIRGEDAWQRSLNRRRFAAYRPTDRRN